MNLLEGQWAEKEYIDHIYLLSIELRSLLSSLELNRFGVFAVLCSGVERAIVGRTVCIIRAEINQKLNYRMTLMRLYCIMKVIKDKCKINCILVL